jgi:DNA-binding FadR family transcriptional regulator
MKKAKNAGPVEARNNKGVAASYVQFQAYLSSNPIAAGDRLPPERELCEILGVPRSELRKALSVAESEGTIWRHVGKGTFLGPRPSDELTTITSIANLTNPSEVMRARILLEPGIAREAALCANNSDIEELKLCIKQSRGVVTWRQCESWDNRFHRAIAEAAHNRLLLALFDALNTVRRAVVWGRLRDPVGPPPSHQRFKQHEAIVRAIQLRDADDAGRLMRAHLEEVQRTILKASGHHLD